MKNHLKTNSKPWRG